jgi:hypothetical protein
MSHFTTYVITKTNSMEELDKLMLPYHEYERTGITDYCVHIDKSEEAIKEYAENKDECASPEEFLHAWYGIHAARIYSEDPVEKPKESYAVVKDGQIVKMYSFTNPNHKWDYYTPYSWKKCNFLTDDVVNADVQVVKKSQLDLCRFMQNRKDYFSGVYNRLKPYFKPDFINWEQARKRFEKDIEKARKIYNEQPSIKDMEAAIISVELFNLRQNINVDDIAAMTEQEFVDSNLREAAPFWAMVIPSGQWIEHGHMGLLAITWDEDKDFNKTWMEAWKDIPDDCYVWRCDCHT